MNNVQDFMGGKYTALLCSQLEQKARRQGFLDGCRNILMSVYFATNVVVIALREPNTRIMHMQFTVSIFHLNNLLNDVAFEPDFQNILRNVLSNIGVV